MLRFFKKERGQVIDMLATGGSKKVVSKQF